MKDVSTRAVIHKRSSHPDSMKKNVLVNEALRVLRNCNEYLKWEEVAEYLSYFMKRLQFSGYDQRFRHEVMKIAFRRYDESKHKSINTSQHNIQKRKKKKWHQDTDTMMFVQATKDGELMKEVQKCADKNKVKLKVMERIDKSKRQNLQWSNPFQRGKYGKDWCLLCQKETNIG